MASDPNQREGEARPERSDPDKVGADKVGVGMVQSAPEPSAGTVSRAAWIGGLAVGVLICALGFGTLSMFDVHKVLHVILEMMTVGAALLVTTRIWHKSASAGTTREDEAR